jgi:glycosyltransferase involved in cell wall biosynthesis
MPTRTDPSPSIGLATQPRDARESGTYIVIVSPSYGGAEKRFFDIFRALRAQGEKVCLIAPSSLTRRLLGDHPDEPDLVDAVISVPLKAWRPLDFIRKYRRLLATLPHRSSFHYPLNCLWPLHLGRGDRVTLSVADCVHTPGPTLFNRVGLWTWLSFFAVDHVDVLSPGILGNMKAYRMARKMSLTPGGTFIEAPPANDSARRPEVVLVSRLVELKGIDHLLDVLPAVWQRLDGHVPPDFGFRIAGYGPLQDHVTTRIAALAKSGVPVEFIGYADAKSLFPGVAIALSMQEATNYPSRVVAEALSSGCGVIIRGTGDSRQFGTLPGLLYCSADLDADELAEQISSLVSQVTTDPTFSSQIREAALDRFSGRASVDYFQRILRP